MKSSSHANYITVVAAVVFGAVRRSPSEPYSVKSGRNYTGTSPRSSSQIAGLEPYTDILRDYCNFGDPICAIGSEPADVGQHMNYFELYDEEAADFVVRSAQGEKVEIHDSENKTTTAGGKGTTTKGAQASATPTEVESGNGQDGKTGAAVGLTIGTTLGFGAALGAVFMLL